MSYRYHFYKISKTEVNEIRNCKSPSDFCTWGQNKGYELEDYDDDILYLPIYHIGTSLYCFGRDVDWACEMQSDNESLFSTDELRECYNDNKPVVCSQTDFLRVINEYKQKIIDWYEQQLIAKPTEKLTVEEKCKLHIEDQLSAWKNRFILPINTDLSTKTICNSGLYEYAIFELTRLYKTFDWENDALILLGW